MISTDPSIKQIIREVLTEEYTKENNKVFSLSKDTTEKYKLVHQFLNFVQMKDQEKIIDFLSDEIILNNELVSNKFAVKEIISIEPDNFTKIEQRSINIRISMPMGGNSGEESNTFFVPWEHLFLCRTSLKIKDRPNSLDLNYVIEFDDSNKITMIDFYSRDEQQTINN